MMLGDFLSPSLIRHEKCVLDNKIQKKLLIIFSAALKWCITVVFPTPILRAISLNDNPSIWIKEYFSELRWKSLCAGTILHRNVFLRNVPFDRIAVQGLLSIDHPTNIFMAQQGKVAHIDRVALFWRRHEETISTPTSKDKYFRYIDHEVRQGLFLAKEFPNTVYDFSYQQAEEHRSWQIYQWALSHKDYATVQECLQMECFPKNWLEHRAEKWFIDNRFKFYLYMYGGGRKICTAIRLLKNKLKHTK